MRKKILTTAFAIAIAAVAAWNVNANREKTEMSDMALANVEALAAGEGSSCCIGSSFKVTSIPGGWHCENNKGNSCCPTC